MIQKSVKFVPMPPTPTYLRHKNKTAQKSNRSLTVFEAVLDNYMLTMASTVVVDPVIFSPVINPPAVATFTL